MKHNVEVLEKKARKLLGSLMDLSDDSGFAEFFKIIHFPGYTTPAEWYMVNELIDVMQKQTTILTELKGSFLAANKAIVSEENVAARANVE